MLLRAMQSVGGRRTAVVAQNRKRFIFWGWQRPEEQSDPIPMFGSDFALELLENGLKYNANNTKSPYTSLPRPPTIVPVCGALALRCTA